MKTVLSVNGNEINAAILAMISMRPSQKGKFVAAVHLIADPEATRPELQFRANVVLFDTEKAAREYALGPDPKADAEQLPASALATDAP